MKKTRDLSAVALPSRSHWSVRFFPDPMRLECEHVPSGVRVWGTVDFRVGDVPWRIVPPRDGAGERLAIEDPSGNIQGYLTFQGTGDRLECLVHHRAAQSYAGFLCLRGSARVGSSSFACRTDAPRESAVVQMASGPADSALNDAIFDVETDLVLHLAPAESLHIRTGEASRFEIEWRACVQDPSRNTWVAEVKRDFFRRRYVPYYTPIDRERCPSPPTGWMSWNTYFDQAGAAENLAEARVGAERLLPFGLEFWSIESWQGNSDRLPVQSFHNLNLSCHPTQFPEGMKKLAGELRALGFRPGIWSAPFGTGNEEFYRRHRDWFLHDEDGQPMSNWCGRYLLDPTLPDVRDHLRNMHRIMAREWGYEFFKIDGMSGRRHGYSAHFFERLEVKRAFRGECPNPFELCVQALRDGIGEDRIFLACQGHFSGPEAKVADAARIGGDIVAPNQPSTWHNILSQARATLNQLFVHNIVLYNDPDTLLVGDFHALEQARVTTTVVALPGQMMFAGDRLAELPPERMLLLRQSLPVCDVRPLDLFPVFELKPIWDLKIERPFAAWDVVALFNWEDGEREIGFEFADLGLDPSAPWLVYEFWENQFTGTHRGSFAMTVPARGTRLLSVHRDLERPQFLSTDRHLTQGGVSLTAMAWDEDAARLSGSVRLVAHHPVSLHFSVPPAYELGDATLDGARLLDRKRTEPSLLSLRIRSETTREATWRLSFRDIGLRPTAP